MASTPLTLAALATSAVPDLIVRGVTGVTTANEPETVAALLDTDRGMLIVSVPQSATAETRMSAELLSLTALASGAREALPFDVPEVLGVIRAGDTRAMIATALFGGRITPEELAEDALLLQPLAETVAAIHALPPSLASQLGLTVRTAEEVRIEADRLVQRAAESRLLPETVHARWLTVLRDDALWDFAPTMTHGSLEADQLLIADDRVVAVLGWSAFSLGDPAVDFAWLGAAKGDVLDSVLSRYSVLRGVTGVRELKARSIFTHELELAKWLLHGLDTHEPSIVDDAVAMLDHLVDRIRREGAPIAPLAPPHALTEGEVLQLLDEMPTVPADPRSETTELEALDEDRMFTGSLEFPSLPLPAERTKPDSL